MKLSIIAVLSTLAVSSAFAPASVRQQSSVVMNAEASEQSRKAFISAAGAAIFGAAVAAPAAFAMDQELVTDPTEVWETGKPNAAAESARMARYQNARTQLTSNFAPIKRLTLERKSPVVSSMFFSVVCYLFSGFWFVVVHVFSRRNVTHSPRSLLRQQTRLDINAPNFEAYKKTYPGLFRESKAPSAE